MEGGPHITKVAAGLSRHSASGAATTRCLCRGFLGHRGGNIGSWQWMRYSTPFRHVSSSRRFLSHK
jgi:hypothetical protein